MTSRILAALLVSTVVLACSERQGAGVVPDAGVLVAVVDAAPPTVDITQCAACQGLVAQQAWTFEGIYSDAACTDPLAQTVAGACGMLPTLGAVSLQYVDDVGGRKVGETANVTLVEQVPPANPRFRKRGATCVRFNEGGVDVAPAACANQRVCRDQTGALACTGCRTFANGCPDFEETRVYATINDPAIKKAGTAKGGGNLERLRQCCTALAGEAKRLGSSPEAGMINAAVVQCNAFITAAGPSGSAPELGALRTMMAGRPVPAICAGF